ncbi:hypothetical protein ALC60_08542 [Trachymyrmex zeteki]|uniref:Phospholipase A2-like domain-containing protein n=1 Tax=Mycetomoellerius zeteki TaxID=64791 RepID=A0A151WWR1_9HYME|nr:hypothetical protein ALC60_08542 [Trachymyrmex zeteki]
MSSRGLLNRAINALPFELHIPGYQFCGPGTRLEKRLARGERGINPLDAACHEPDIAYSHSNELAKRHTADKLLPEEARKRIVARDLTLGERAAGMAVWTAMKAKTKLGMGLKTSLVDEAAGVAKVVNDSKAAQHQLQELQRHNRVMEGHGVYLAPYKRGRGVARRKKNVDETLKLPKGVTTNVQLQQLANCMRIPYFRGEIAPYISTVSTIFDRRRNSNDIW